MIVIDEDLVRFAIRHILRSEMLHRQMGIYNWDLQEHVFNPIDFEEINEIIKDEMFPDGYYKLCELINEKPELEIITDE